MPERKYKKGSRNIHLERSERQFGFFLRNYEGNGTILDLGAGERRLGLLVNNKYLSADIEGDQDYKIDLNNKLPFKDNSFGCIVCFEVIEHLKSPNAFLIEVSRVLRKDGLFFCSIPNEYNFVQRLYYLIGRKTFMDIPFKTVDDNLHIHKPRVKDIKKLLSRFFDIMKVSYYWQCRNDNYSDIVYSASTVINIIAKVFPSLFCRTVAIKAKKKKVDICEYCGRSYIRRRGNLVPCVWGSQHYCCDECLEEKGEK